MGNPETATEGAQDADEQDELPTTRRVRIAAAKAVERVRPGAGGYITQNFHASEFHCHDGTRFPSASLPELRRHCELILEPMRARFGRCTVVSAYRHPKYNKGVEGEDNSIHQWGHRESADRGAVATDVRFAKGKPDDWAAYFRQLRKEKYKGNGGLGTYRKLNFVHVDSRSWRADWP